MSKQRHGTANHLAQPLRSIPKVTRQLSELGIEERTQVDIVRRVDPARHQGSIPSITGRPTRMPKASTTTPPLNVIPFTKPRAIAAVVAANPHALVIEASANNALKNFDNTVLPASPKPQRHGDEPTSQFSPAPRLQTGWTPPGAVPTVPAKAANIPPSGKTVVPVPPLTSRSVGPVIALPPIDVPAGTPVRPVSNATVAAFPAAAPVAAYPVAKAPPPVQPVYQQPVYQQPVYQQPVYQQPVYQQPVYQQYQAPAHEVPKPVAPVGVTPIVMPPIAKPVTHAESMFAELEAPEHAAATPSLGNKWAVFEKLGLGAPKINAQKLIVSAYRMLGFAILTIIVVVLVGYIANTAFFYMSSSWVVPAQVSPTDERVVALQSQLADQQNSRDRLADELNQAERSIAAQQSFQLEFAKAIKMDLDGRKAALDRVRELANNAASTRRAIKSQNAAYAGNTRRRMKQEFEAGLIDRNAMLSGGVQLAALTSSTLSLAERQAEFETRAAELEATTRSLDAILSNVDGDSALSYEVLRIKQEYAASRLDLAKAMEARNTIKSSLGRQDKIVDKLKKSSYLRAVEDGAAVAFVPYSNLSNVSKGTSVYACKVGMVFCHHVGEVLEVLPGEVQFKHPQRDKQLRGQMVEMRLDDEDDDAAAGDVLFVGSKPLFI